MDEIPIVKLDLGSLKIPVVKKLFEDIFEPAVANLKGDLIIEDKIDRESGFSESKEMMKEEVKEPLLDSP